jgi:hypothetical protein
MDKRIDKTDQPQDAKALRKELFKKLCRHVRVGYSLDCFSELSETTCRKYLETYPEEWPREEFEKALRDGKQAWEDIGKRQAMGTCMGNSRSWYYNMSNRYGWRDRVDVEADTRSTLQVQVVSYSRKDTPDASEDRPTP